MFLLVSDTLKISTVNTDILYQVNYIVFGYMLFLMTNSDMMLFNTNNDNKNSKILI